MRHSVFLKLCVSTVTVPPSDSDYVNRSASLQQFRLIHRRRAHRLRSDDGGHQYQALDRFILREVLACRRRRARLSTKLGKILTTVVDSPSKSKRNYITIHLRQRSAESGKKSLGLQVGWAQVSTRIC